MKKVLWKFIVLILMIPICILFGWIMFGLIVGAMLNINPFIFNGIPAIGFCVLIYAYFAYKIIFNKEIE